MTEPKAEDKHYDFEYKGIRCDPYRILDLYKINHPAQQHAIKKLLRLGESVKPLKQDLAEVIRTLQRWEGMIAEDEPTEEIFVASMDSINRKRSKLGLPPILWGHFPEVKDCKNLYKSLGRKVFEEEYSTNWVKDIDMTLPNDKGFRVPGTAGWELRL